MSDRPGDIVLPLHVEEATVDIRRVERAAARVTIEAVLRDHVIDTELTSETADIERIPIGRAIDVMPETRQEGDVTIIPVVEEVVVVERRLILKEEIRIRRTRTTEHHREIVNLREQIATVEWTEAEKREDETTPGSSMPSLNQPITE